jgi:hypothetical protein
VRGRAQPRLRRARQDLAQHRDPFLHVQPLQPPDLAAGRGGHVAEFPAVHGDQGRLAERELDVPAKQRVQGGGGIRRGDDPAAALVVQRLADPQQHLRQHVFLAREVPVDARAGHADGRPDVVDGHTVVPAVGEQLRRRVEDLLAPCPVPGARRRMGLGAAQHPPILDVIVSLH